ncbi:MAG: hypothetical protein VB997_01015, partial [Opitutales bacterium]
AEPEALVGFAGRRVIKDTTQADLPEGFQTSEFLLEHGLIDQIVPRLELRERIISLLNLLSGSNGKVSAAGKSSLKKPAAKKNKKAATKATVTKRAAKKASKSRSRGGSK